MSCTYGVSVAGITICFDAIFDPLVNDIVDPVENFFQSLLNTIENDVLTAIQNVVNTLSQALQNALTALETFFTNLGQTIVSDVTTFVNSYVLPFLQNILSHIDAGISDLTNLLGQGFNNVKNFLNSVGNQILSGLGSVGNLIENTANTIFNDLQSLGAAVVSTVNQAFNNVVSGFTEIGNSIIQALQSVAQPFISLFTHAFDDLSQVFTSFSSAVTKGLEEVGTELYNALKIVVNDLLAGLHDLVNAFTNSLEGVIHNFLNVIKPRGRDEIQNILSEALGLTALTSAVYTAGAVGVKVAENLHPLHSLHLQELFDKITELFAVHRIPEKVVEGFFTFGLFAQMEYALNYLLKPRLTDLAVETRAVWYGAETTDELRQGLALEGYQPDLAEKYVATIYRPMPPFILRYLIETGLASQDFLTRQLQMEGFDPQDIPTILKIFNALELVPFQNQVKSVIYTYYRNGLMTEEQATQIMNVFQIPKTQQQWILETATLDFNNEQKTLLGNLTLDLLAKAELTVDQAIQSLVKIGYREERARVIANVRAVTAAPPPPKSTRAQLLQEALQNLGVLGLAPA